MESVIPIVVFLIFGYLSGSVNYAIIVTSVVAGKDIRQLGNGNPGTSNVARSVGKFWGVLVGLLDALKGVIPALIARLTVFQGDTAAEFLVLYCIGIAAVLGHCLPVFYRFKGGGGIGTMQGVSLFFVPVEYLASMLIGGSIVLLGVKKVQFRFGRWIPIAFTILTPFATLATAVWLDIPLFAHISIGGHNWGLVAGVFAMSLTILVLNLSIVKDSREEYREVKQEEKPGEQEQK